MLLTWQRVISFFGTQELCMDLLTLKMQISVDLQLQCTQ